MRPMSIAEAKQRVGIPQLWRHLGLPGVPKKSCKSPFRQDRQASFSVSADGRLFNDFASGKGGDAIDFLREATGLSNADACRRFVELAGGSPCRPSSPLPPIRRATTPPEAWPLPRLTAMRHGTPEQWAALAELRHVHIEAVKIADDAGLLRFGVWEGWKAWFVVDGSRRNAQVRRMDGRRWNGTGPKAVTLPGCHAGWPLGAGAGDYQKLCMVEGGPDLLAALHYIVLEGAAAEIAPVAMLGAKQRIHPDALPLFAGKRIRIYAHADEAGRMGAQQWTAQLAPLGCHVDAVDFSGLRKADGSPISDLNDCILIHPEDAGELEGILP